jgi:hypothetical protein
MDSQQTASTSLPPGLTQAGLQSLLDAASWGSAFNRVPPLSAPVAMPNTAAASLQPNHQVQLLLAQLLAQPGSLHLMPQVPHPSLVPGPGAGDADNSNSRARPARSADRGASTSYANRHQQAEARRRSRINERLDALRRIVPHTERANTASFLEDVVRYVQRLQRLVGELEAKLGLPPSVAPPPVPISFGQDISPEATATAATGLSNISNMDRLALHALLQQAVSTGTMHAPAAAPAAARPAALPTVSEELAMAAHLAPGSAPTAAVMAESQPAGADTATGGGGGRGDRSDNGAAVAIAPAAGGGINQAQIRELLLRAAAGLHNLPVPFVHPPPHQQPPQPQPQPQQQPQDEQRGAKRQRQLVRQSVSQ